MIASVGLVKKKLGILEKDLDSEEDIRSLLAAVESEILSLTNYEESGTTRVDTIRNVRLAEPTLLKYRPVASIESATGRDFGSLTSFSLTAEIVDADRGEVVFTGGFGPAAYPLPGAPRVPWQKARAPIIDVVTINYTTDAKQFDPAFVDGLAALTAFRFRRQKAGAAASTSLSGISESMMDDSIPSWVRDAIFRHVRTSGRWI